MRASVYQQQSQQIHARFFQQCNMVDVLYNGLIVKSGTKELAKELEAKGYDWIIQESALAW
jgi:Fe-S cluster assembly ATPase SufC